MLSMSHKDDLVEMGLTRTDIFCKYDMPTVVRAFKKAGFQKVATDDYMNGQFRCYYYNSELVLTCISALREKIGGGIQI